MTTTLGSSSPICSTIASSDVSASILISDRSRPRRVPRAATCAGDSSPDTYSAFIWPDSAASACSVSVDLPMPGSPPINVTPPGTNPPPSARSNSGSPDGQRRSEPGCTSESLTTRAVEITAAVALLVVCRDSSSVFQALHAEHWPCHLLAVAPQSRQTNEILALAMTFPFCISNLMT